MDNNLYKLNTTYAVVDTIKCVFAILSFGFAAWFCNKWWINLFSILPLMMYSTHTIVIESDIECMQEQDGDHGYDN